MKKIIFIIAILFSLSASAQWYEPDDTLKIDTTWLNNVIYDTAICKEFRIPESMILANKAYYDLIAKAISENKKNQDEKDSIIDNLLYDSRFNKSPKQQ